MKIEDIKKYISELAEGVNFWSLRILNTEREHCSIRQTQFQPIVLEQDSGYCLTVFNQGGSAYVCSSDLSRQGLKDAFEKALNLAEHYAKQMILAFDAELLKKVQGEYRSHSQSEIFGAVAALKETLHKADKIMGSDQRIVDHAASYSISHEKQTYLCSLGSEAYQEFSRINPILKVTAFDKGQVQTRSFAGGNFCRQGGSAEILALNLENHAALVRDEALELLYADNCPSENLDVLLAPDQMILQIHESIGHPLELDRILGDERNYAGRSFVEKEMFGQYQYGSKLLNIVFDPGVENELASYSFDDEAGTAEKKYLIKDGILKSGIGGLLSQKRSGIDGVSSTRATSWNRPAIDRMANINLEAGDSSIDDMIAATERGVYMKTNISWSIDDSRNKFQFGCEWGQMIENGKLTKLVRKPNYRGHSAEFWRNLKMVGDASQIDVLGTPYCGKGEPNQAISVGHATPACLFSDVAVFGGV